jgi:nucleotide-binding universal stress UspA family protein
MVDAKSYGRERVRSGRSQFERKSFRFEPVGKCMGTSRQVNEYAEADPASLLVKKREGQHRMVVVPFESFDLSPHTFEWALNVAESTAAELIFLCVYPSGSSTRTMADTGNRLVELRRLQAQIEDCPVPVRLETVTGSAAQLVLNYVDQTRANMIVIPGDPVEPTTRASA